MSYGIADRIGRLIRERTEESRPGRGIERGSDEIDDLVLEIGDAEERGDWPLASRLRSRRLAQRLTGNDLR
jgi:hypothetical protein